MKKVYLFLGIALLSLSAFSQEWPEMMSDSRYNFYDVQSAFEAYWEDKDTQQKGKGWKPFKRWEWFVEQRVYPSGDRQIMDEAMARYFDEAIENREDGGRTETGTWTFLGPTNVPANRGGAGRCNFLRFDPQNPAILWTGAPAGGLWKSVNGGDTWINWNTDYLPVIGCSDIAIDPNNSNILYLATGDGDAGDTYSVGILKSTDGGLTWNKSGLDWTVNQTRRIRRLLIHPTNSNLLIAATSDGIYRTTNGGTTWTRVQTGSFFDLEFKPGDPTVVYGSSTQFYRSTNGGSNWTAVASGLPPSNQVRRIAIAITPANANYVYLLLANTDDSGLQGIYRSTDAGLNFSLRADSPNLLGWNSNGSDSGGQGWYDLAIAVSPTNASQVIVGGVNVWRSTDGGINWSINGHWTGSGAPYVHADIHDLIYYPSSSNTYFAACDGGVFRTSNNGGAWSDLSDGLEIGQLYRISNSATNPNLVISGWQDNGTNRLNNLAWRRVIGGDGMECIIDHSNANIMYGALYYGNIRKSTNGGNNFSTIVSSNGDDVHSEGLWVTPYVMHPDNSQTLLVGKSALYRSTDGGNDWETLGNISGSGQIRAIAYAPSNPSWIYASRTNTIHRSQNSGSSFTNVTTGTLPNQTITYIGVSPDDHAVAYVTYSGYSSTNKVFRTTNGGLNWQNFSTGLPNLPVNCVVAEKGINGGVYVGTDVGVYYRDATMTAWIPFSDGMPNVIVNELEIHYGTGKIRAGTYGRGLWESDLYEKIVAPVAQLEVSEGPYCAESTISFQDMSLNNPTSRQWQFPGGIPASSIELNPSVTYTTPGTYQVTLSVSNAAGTQQVTSEIVVQQVPEIVLVASTQEICEGESVQLSASGADEYLWPDGQQGSVGTIEYIPTASGPVTVTGALEGCIAEAEIAIIIHPLPPLAILLGDTGICIGATLLIEATGAESYFWPDQTVSDKSLSVSPTSTTSYTVIGMSDQGCETEVSVTVDVYALPEVLISASSPAVCPGTSISLVASGAESYLWEGYPGVSELLEILLNEEKTFIVTGTSLEGCQAQASISIGMLPLPTVVVNASTQEICSGESVILTAEGAETYFWEGLDLEEATISINPLSTQSFTVTGTSVDGCQNTSSVWITVFDLPNMSINASATQVCPGVSVQLEASGAFTYVWEGQLGETPYIEVNPFETTTFLVTGTSDKGCVAEASLLIEVFPLPQVALNAASPYVCLGESIILTASGATTYWWEDFTETTPELEVTPVEQALYRVIGYSEHGCEAEASLTVNVLDLGTDIHPWPDATCLTGIYQVAPPSGASINGYVLPSGVSVVSQLPGGWLLLNGESAGQVIGVQVASLEGECVVATPLSGEVAAMTELNYDPCGRYLALKESCADQGTWYRLNRSTGEMEQMEETGSLLTTRTIQDLEQYIYVHTCPGVCRQVAISPLNPTTQPCDESQFSLDVTPNPASNQVTLAIRHGLGGALTLYVWDAIGKQYLEERIQHPGGLHHHVLTISSWSSGGYILRVEEKEGRSRTERLIVR